MIGIIIAVSFLCLCLLLFILPVNVVIDYKEEFAFVIRLAVFPVFRSKKPAKQAKQEQKQEKEADKPAKTKENVFLELFRKEGVTEGVKQLFAFAGNVLKRIGKLLKHIRFHKIRFLLAVASGDAAQTAVTYGEICTVAYPLFSFLDHASNVAYKEISISADFTATKMKPEFSAVISARLFFLLAAAVGVLMEFLSFRKQVQKDE